MRARATPVAARVGFRFSFRPGSAPPADAPASDAAPSAPAPADAAREQAPSPPSPPPSPPLPPSSIIEVAVEGGRPPREATRHALDVAEITRLPGTNGDALRSVTNLPGVARPPGLAGFLIVRGFSPRDSVVFADGTALPLAYHFGGLSSVIPSEMLERIDFYPGNFGPEFGRAAGGAIDIGVRSPRRSGVGGMLQLDLIDARLIAEAALSDDTRVMIGGRRSWLDLWLGPALESTGVEVSTAPVYYDYQALIEHDLSDTRLRLFGFGSSDRLKLLFTSPDPSDPALGGRTAQSDSFWRLQARSDTRLSTRARWLNTLSVGRDRGAGALLEPVGRVPPARSARRQELEILELGAQRVPRSDELLRLPEPRGHLPELRLLPDQGAARLAALAHRGRAR